MAQNGSTHSLISASTLEILTKLGNLLGENHIRSYIVGGFVRDMSLGREVADIDVAVSSDALEIAPRIAGELGGKYVLLDQENGLGRVVLPGEKWRIIDFSTFKGSIEQDLARRDFTIDAMAIELKQFTSQPFSPSLLIDPFKGYTDLSRRVVRAVMDTAFESDPARLLRAVRLAGELGFIIDRRTEELIRRDSHLLARVAGERTREEMLRLLAVYQSGQLLRYLSELGLLTAMIPELVKTVGSEQPGEHYWDVFNHSMEAVAAVCFLLRQGTWQYAGEKVLAAVPWPAPVVKYFEDEVSRGSTRGLLLKLAALLHDIAKPQTRAVDADGRLRFLGHAKEGAVMAAGILERLRFSARETKLLELMVMHHMRPLQMSPTGLPSNRAIYRYFRDTGEAGIGTLYLSLADHLATRGPNLDLGQWQEHNRIVEYVLTQRFEQESLVIPPKLIDGNDLINIFNIAPGPEVGKLLEAVREAQGAGELATRLEALSYVRSLLTSPAALSSRRGGEESEKEGLPPLSLAGE
jgi:poly(A) polymerase